MPSEGDKVEFDKEQGDKGPMAVKVRKAGEEASEAPAEEAAEEKTEEAPAEEKTEEAQE